VSYVRERLGEERVSERRACRVLGQARSTQRRELLVGEDEPRLVGRMVELVTQYGRYGLPKDHGDVNRGRMESESQTSGAFVETRRVEGAF